jgi:hypothetical protein
LDASAVISDQREIRAGGERIRVVKDIRYVDGWMVIKVLSQAERSFHRFPYEQKVKALWLF